MTSEISLSSDYQHSSCRSCVGGMMRSKWLDVALLTGVVVTLTLGILASTGFLDFMGSTRALYFSYSMYACAGLLLILELVKCIAFRKTSSLSPCEICYLKKQAVLFVKDYKDENFPPEQLESKKLELISSINSVIDDSKFRNDPVGYMESLRLEHYAVNLYTFPNNPTYLFLFTEIGKMRTLERKHDSVYWGHTILK